jgi:release factor glutamine methyltransferase
MSEAAVAVRLDMLLRDVAAALREEGIADAGREARLLIGHFAAITATGMISDPEREITSHVQDAVLSATRRRATGEPLHRIFGRRAFYGIELMLTPATLEPRPDTEILVDRIIPHARRIIAESGRCNLLDLGTGTGAVALAVLAEIDAVTATGVDIDAGAVEVALANARMNGLEDRFSAAVSDWFSGVNEKFHIIVSNPPYISAGEFSVLADDVRLYDPETALLGGFDGLDAYRAIAGSAAGYLVPGGVVGVEIGYRQQQAVAAIFADMGYRLIDRASDLAGRDRVLIFNR